MKKSILFLSILILPCLALAQSDGLVIDDSYKSVLEIPASAKLNDHLSVFQVNTKNDSFDLLAVNDNFQVVWHTTIDGYGVNIGRFKDKLLAVAATEHTTYKGNGNTYKGILIDPATGNKLIEKTIYKDTGDYIEVPKVLITNDRFKLAIRESNVTRKMYRGLSSLFTLATMPHIDKEYNASQKLEIIDFSENLEPVNTLNAAIGDRLITIAFNKNNDVFVAWLNGQFIEVYKYVTGKNIAVGQLRAAVDIEADAEAKLEEMILFKTSPSQPDNLYYTLLYRTEEKDVEISLGKMNFAKGTNQSTSKIFLNDDMKYLQKSFIPINKKIRDADLGSPKNFRLKDMQVSDNSEIISLQGTPNFYFKLSNSVDYVEGLAVLYNVFDTNLNLKFQQILPASFKSNSFLFMKESNHLEKDKLYMVSNIHKSGLSLENTGLYAILNLNSGQWEKMEVIKEKSIRGAVVADRVIWLDKGFIVPYFKNGTGGFGYVKYEMLIQGNQY